MNRKRGIFLLPEEMQTTERLPTKRELALRGKQPTCPFVPGKIRKSLSHRHSNKKPTPLCFNNNVTLSPMYDPQLRLSYIDQVFAKFDCMGEGSFGKVYRVRSREDNKLYAIKRLKANISANDRYAEVKNNEIIGYDPNCVQYFMAWEENCETFILLECCDMSLADYSKLNNDIPEELLWNVLYDICKAMNFLHKRNLLHLDIKPGNIMMKRGTYKLGDFGLLVDLQTNDHVNKSTLSDGDSKYLAMEVLHRIYTNSCDVFGLGITLLELATDIELPDHGPLWHQLRNNILPPEFYERVTLGLKVIIERMIANDYQKRPSAEKILSYSSLKDVAKRDNKYPRTDFASPYLKAEDKYEIVALPPLSINNNDNTTTPPCSLRFSCEEDSLSSWRNDDENDVQFSGRKSLFSQLNDTFSSNNSSPMTENSLLACSLNEISVEIDASHSEDAINCDQFVSKNIITSTPVLRTKQSKRIPKAKLTFD
ncbi:membrane-associated tyrosine- and threonine-specific cdc2-inhibitory kinase [Sitophilus oryzae]|uniref:non-specific serine/threonine protein kinase n=1 Tax=Sitophilus oryzae TaxID=7048 RepID=A0A6J2XZT9_SITOR|nr:membrane-associated tyrosine- and threonine-specific cdc2-inhibitory kinase [Sitophilus oryzae]